MNSYTYTNDARDLVDSCPKRLRLAGYELHSQSPFLYFLIWICGINDARFFPET
ncbi:hypothetical protein VCR12J2_640198 [Vibrio coralliirubri]|nr:hypothetical protein VCR12J2_640198 [Vibrio coralliirubri]